MTASEFAFLAMGLVLGVVAGAALVQVLRSRTSAAREVRVTMAPDAIPRRRPATLSDDAFTPADAAMPARGGPADRRSDVPAPPLAGPERRTPVQAAVDPETGTEGVGDGVASDPRPGTLREPAFRLSAPAGSAGDIEPALASAGQAVPVSGGADPMMTALRATAAKAAVAAVAASGRPDAATANGRSEAATANGRSEGTAAGGGPPASRNGRGSAAVLAAPTARASRPVARSSDGGTGDATAPSIAPEDATEAAPSSPCAESRRLAEERCVLATRARQGAVAAEERLRGAQRALEAHEEAAATASVAADARAVRRAKDDAQARFRNGRAMATTTDDVEAAARAWLLEINGINADAREAVAALARERDAADEIARGLERLSVDADAARISAETAEAACLAAREVVAACEEREAAGPRGHMPVLPPTDPDDDLPVGAAAGAAALGTGGSPRIFRLLRGDRAAMAEMVAALSAGDPDERRKWQLAMSDLIDAILADSIAAAALDFPREHPFWGPYSIEQCREIAQALSSLGYRFDGLGGWVDGRVPSQRDLSLALGYAGIDPMRMRQWPTETEMTELYRDVEVAAAEHLSGAAGDLTLGELVSMLGRRADGLAEVWNHWGRIRPLLLEDR